MKLLDLVRAKLSRALPQRSFLRSVSILAGGTALAQGLGVMMLPVITRLYTPENFSVLAVYTSVLAIAAGVACLRLDIAIPLPKSDADAANLLSVSLLICTCLSIFAGVTTFLFADQVVFLLRQPELRPYIWMVPFGIWLSSSFSAVQFWATRKKRYGSIAKTRIRQTGSSICIQLAFGLGGSHGPLGLLLGQAISSGAGVLGLARLAWSEDKKLLRDVSRARMRRVIATYKKFPKYSVLEAFANNGAAQLPVLLIAAVSSDSEAGYLLLAMKAMAMPLGLIGGAVSQVYLSRAPEEWRAGRLSLFTLDSIAGLAKVGIGPLIFAGITSPILFPILFGVEWKRAGEMVAWMTPWLVLQFLSSPVSMALHITNQQRAALALQVVGLVVRLGSTALAASIFPSYTFIVYALSGLAFYLLYLIVIAKVVKIKGRALCVAVFGKTEIPIVWAGAGVATVIAVQSLQNL
jgi:O-antigen/teichoic acid export membrane protein